MFSISKKGAVLASILLMPATSAFAGGDHHGSGLQLNENGLKPINADSHAPIGVMGDHMHGAGEWMMSYRYMRMEMNGNRIDEDGVTPEEIVATVPNLFFGLPGQPPGLRIIPTEMTMEMHMLGAMYAPTDWLTLMAMTMYLDNTMDHITFNGPGTARIGTFTTKSSGFGDTRLSGLIRGFDSGIHHLHFNLGVSLPTGSTDERDTILAPNGMTMDVRLPYPMQLGSGTYDLLPGVTYTGHTNRWGWGAQYMGTFRTGDDNGYSLGDIHEVTGWLSYRWKSWISTSARLAYKDQGKIDGIDPNIVGPVQTANPDFQGGETVNLLFGINLAGQVSNVRGHRFAIEASMPLHRDLNGPQMETDLTVTAGWQYAF